jgi:hypothetical protein
MGNRTDILFINDILVFADGPPFLVKPVGQLLFCLERQFWTLH